MFKNKINFSSLIKWIFSSFVMFVLAIFDHYQRQPEYPLFITLLLVISLISTLILYSWSFDFLVKMAGLLKGEPVTSSTDPYVFLILFISGLLTVFTFYILMYIFMSVAYFIEHFI